MTTRNNRHYPPPEPDSFELTEMITTPIFHSSHSKILEALDRQGAFESGEMVAITNRRNLG